MTELKPYPAYKESGTEWLGSIPADWGSCALGRFVRFRNGADYAAVEVMEGGYPVYGSGGEFRRASDYLFDGESVLFGRKGTVDRPLHVDGRFWTVDTMYFTEIDETKLLPRFVYYWATQLPYGYWLTNTALPSMTQSDLASAKIPYIPMAEQIAISTFLDRETAEIDAFIADQEELIGLLAERRAATISHAVTKGLDPTVPMKDSRIEWFGDIPSHWKGTRLSRFFRVTLGKMLDGGKEVAEGATVLPYIRAANIQECGLDLESVNEMPYTSAEARSLDIRKNDLLVVEGGAVGVNAHITKDMSGWSFQKTVNRVRPVAQADSRFVGFALDALRWSGVIDMLANKSTIAHLTAEKLERIEFAFPPPAEQTAISDYLDAETATVDAAIADAKEAITLSRERRAALISAAVTGKIDVRGHESAA